LHMDPRYYQLAVQIALLLLGILQLQFEISPACIVAVVALAGLLQLLFTRRYHLPANLLSAANSALSILLLLRSNALGWLLLAVLIAIASKFLVTVRRRHLFNPSALGIVVVILIGDVAWVTPGQWGRDIWLLLLAAGGGLILLIGRPAWRRPSRSAPSMRSRSSGTPPGSATLGRSPCTSCRTAPC